jgi:AcrR family transcriptional regulator
MAERIKDNSVRREKFVQAALRVAKRDGFEAINKVNVSKEAGVAESLLYHYFDGVPAIKKLVMKRAVALRIIPIVARGIALGYVETRDMNEGLQKAAMSHMLEELNDADSN